MIYQNPPVKIRRSLALLVLAVTLLAATGTFAASRTIETTYGPVTVEGEIDRVVTLYEGALDTAYAVGVTPVGAIITRGGSDVAGYMKERVGDIQIVGAPGETNLEAVIALQPDLILAPAALPEQQYRLLSQVAPTLVPDVEMFKPDSWEHEARFYAQALGREAEIEKVIDRITERKAEVASLIDDAIPQAQRKTSLVRWMPQGAMIMSPGLFSASLLSAVGFEVQDGGIVKEGRPHSYPLSHENLSLMDGDWLFLATLDADGRKALAAAESAPAFARLSVVEAGHVIPVDGQLWTSASGPLAAEAILDDIVEKTGVGKSEGEQISDAD